MKILNVKITILPKEEIIKNVALFVSQKKKFVIFTPNPEIITASLKLPELREALNSGDINLPDGVGLKIASYLKNHDAHFPTIIHGIDFMLDLCKEAEKNNWTVGLLGGFNQTAEKTKDELIRRYPKLKIEYVYGDFEYDPQNPSPANYELKTKLPLDILFVALGTPKEQLWISQNKDTFPAAVFMEVGGAFDILSGRLRRAPGFARKLGLEWLFRLFQEPRRITRQFHLLEFLFRVLTTKNSVEY